MRYVIVEFDGGGPNGAGQCAIAAIVRDARTGDRLAQAALPIGAATNNVAEYLALLKGLDLAWTLEATHLTIFGDSRLVIRQVNGKWRVREPRLKPLHTEVLGYLSHFESWRLEWVPRDFNEVADALAREVLA